MKTIALALLLLIPSILCAQTAAPMPFVKSQFLTTNGLVAAGYKICTFAAGTTTPSATWQDSSKLATNTNPVTLDNGGRANIFLGATSYKINLYAPGNNNTCSPLSMGTLIWSEDNIEDIALIAHSQLIVTYQSVPYASLMAFDAAAGTIFKTVLTGNVATSGISNPMNGQVVQLTICQDGTGGRTFSWPPDMLTPPAINPQASGCTQAPIYYDGVNWRPWSLITATIQGCLVTTSTCKIVNVDAEGSVLTRPLFQAYTTALTLGGLTALSSSATSTVATATALVEGIYVNNITSSPVSLYVTDGNGNYYVGPNYQVPAGTSGMLDIIPTGGLPFTGGIKAWAGTSTALNILFVGKMSP